MSTRYSHASLVRGAVAIGALIAVAAAAELASAQAYTPDVTTSSQFRQQATGFGFTSDSIIQGTINRGGFGAGGSISRGGASAGLGGGGPVSKPFSNASNGPTVSPFLGLFNSGVIGDEIDNFQSFVRPQLEQQRVNQQFRQQAQQINRQLQQRAAPPAAAMNPFAIQEQRLNAQFQQAVGQAAFNPAGSQTIMPTGHTTVYGVTGRFYPTRP